MTANNIKINEKELKKIRKGKIDRKKSKELSGYASIDKPWQKYYSEEVIQSELPKMTMYDYICQNAKENLNKTALIYFDCKITYQEFFDNIERVADSLIKYGVKKGDIVSIIMPTTPESIYLLYGLNKIGAVGNFIDPRTSSKGLQKYITETHSDIVFVLDSVSDKIKNLKTQNKVKTIINIPPTESMNAKAKITELKKMIKEEKKEKEESTLKALYKTLKQQKEVKKVYGYRKECIQWTDFFKIGEIKEENRFKSLYYEENMPAVIVHTGGTTGNPKSVVLTNDNLNNAAYDCGAAGYDFQTWHNWLNIMPLFIAYGCGNGLHIPMAYKMETIIIPAFKSSEFADLLLKYRPNHMVGVPEHYGHIIHDKRMQEDDLSYIIAPVVGGDAMNIELEQAVNEFLKNGNCDYKIVKGYGMTEVCAAVCACTSNENNELGSVGTPFPHSTISIFDSETLEELPYQQGNEEPIIGEICIQTPNMMLEYYENKEETDKILREHSDGKIWVHSGDLGYMNNNGQLFIIGRMKDMIIRHDGFKLYPSIIEKAIIESDLVTDCKVVGISDQEHIQGEVPYAYVVLEKEFQNQKTEKIKKSIYEQCEKQLPDYSQPEQIEFIDELPQTNIGKVDTQTLKNKAESSVKRKILIKE